MVAHRYHNTTVCSCKHFCNSCLAGTGFWENIYQEQFQSFQVPHTTSKKRIKEKHNKLWTLYRNTWLGLTGLWVWERAPLRLVTLKVCPVKQWSHHFQHLMSQSGTSAFLLKHFLLNDRIMYSASALVLVKTLICTHAYKWAEADRQMDRQTDTHDCCAAMLIFILNHDGTVTAG